MGFRSGVITEDYGVTWPEWFIEKYQTFIHFNPDKMGAISTKHEYKLYFTLKDFFTDIQKAIYPGQQHQLATKFIGVMLHECGGISRFEITAESIIWTEPTEWELVDEPTHDYCYGCSDSKRLTK